MKGFLGRVGNAVGTLDMTPVEPEPEPEPVKTDQKEPVAPDTPAAQVAYEEYQNTYHGKIGVPWEGLHEKEQYLWCAVARAVLGHAQEGIGSLFHHLSRQNDSEVAGPGEPEPAIASDPTAGPTSEEIEARKAAFVEYRENLEKSRESLIALGFEETPKRLEEDESFSPKPHLDQNGNPICGIGRNLNVPFDKNEKRLLRAEHGRNFTTHPMTYQEAITLCQYNLHQCAEQVDDFIRYAQQKRRKAGEDLSTIPTPEELVDRLPPTAIFIFMEMIFQMGVGSVSGFGNMVRGIEKYPNIEEYDEIDDYQTACQCVLEEIADEMADSVWHNDPVSGTPERAARAVARMKRAHLDPPTADNPTQAA